MRRTRIAPGVVRRAMFIAVLLGFVCTLSFGAARAAEGEPIDPLQRAKNESGGLSFSASLQYRPESVIGFDFGADSGIEPYVRHRHDVHFELRGSYGLGERVRIGAAAQKGLFLDSRLDGSTGKSIESETAFSPLLGVYTVSYRLSPLSPLDPMAGLAFFPGRHLEAEASASILKDPLIITGSLAYLKSLNGHGGVASFGAGAGFVANDVFTLSAFLHHAQPVDQAAPSSSSVSFRLGYALDDEARDELAATAGLTVEAGSTKLWFGLEWGWRPRS